MASSDGVGHSQDKNNKKHGFTSWIKKMASIKGSSGSKRGLKRGRNSSPAKQEKARYANGGYIPDAQAIDGEGFHSNEHEAPPSCSGPNDNRSTAPTVATNPDTLHSEAGHSKTGTTNTFGGGMSSHSGGGNSIFSSSNQSSRSLTTTLTTVQSTAASNQLNLATPGGNPNAGGNNTPSSASTPQLGHSHHISQSSTYFSHQYPTTPIASAVPQHLQPRDSASHLPTTYRSATANNLLTDNASIITLASSSHALRHRTSIDTDASIRAIPPASAWGGSRESLPLSVLSQTAESARGEGVASGAASPIPPGSSYPHSQRGPSISGLVSAERASVYSTSGPGALHLASDRNSVYAPRSAGATGAKSPDGDGMRGAGGGGGGADTDGASTRGTIMTNYTDAASTRQDGASSVRSGVTGSLRMRNDSLPGAGGGVVGGAPQHGRANSTTGSIGAASAMSLPLSTGGAGVGHSALTSTGRDGLVQGEEM